MTLQLEHFAALDVPDHLEPELLALTLPAGDMAKVYRACRSTVTAIQRTWRGHVIVARLNGTVVAWALRWQITNLHRHWHLHLYVDPAHRRSGIGTALEAAAHHLLRRTTEIRGSRWDDTSTAFWDAIDDDRQAADLATRTISARSRVNS